MRPKWPNKAGHKTFLGLLCFFITPENLAIVEIRTLYGGHYFCRMVNWLGFLKKYNLHGILCDDNVLWKRLASSLILMHVET